MFKLSYPIAPIHVNQGFGENPAYYARFHDEFGKPEKGHMGIDFMAAHGTPLYAPCDGNATYVVDEHGGDGIHLTFSDNNQWYKVILWHMCAKDDPTYPFTIPTDGSATYVKRGQLLGYTDNSGAPFESSGDHLHFGLVPLKADGIRILNPGNGFGGCVDPMPFFDGSYAHASTTEVPYDQAVANAKASGEKPSFIQQVLALLKNHYKK